MFDRSQNEGTSSPRRLFLKSGLAGSAILVTAAAQPAGAAGSEATRVRYVVGVVHRSAQNQPRELVVRYGNNATVTLTPIDFSPDWEFIKGDFISVDLLMSEAFPYLQGIAGVDADGNDQHLLPVSDDSGRADRLVSRSS